MDSNDLTFDDAISALEKLISKSRAHLYKPIQIAEILYRDRIEKGIDLDDLETYRNPSKSWRDEVSKMLVGSKSTSSAKFQDNLFESNAMPPALISILGEENRKTGGRVEAFIYGKLKEKLLDIREALNYCASTSYEDFSLSHFIGIFEQKAGLKRSLDKIYEIVVYGLFSSLIEAMGVEINISVQDSNNPVLIEFADFSEKVLGINASQLAQNYPAKLFRVGVANAADRGLDMWGNFGLAVQIKHLSLSEEIAEYVADSILADRIVIVCKDAEESIIRSILGQIGWKGRIQSIVTFGDLDIWYDKAMRGEYSNRLGQSILKELSTQMEIEFPAASENQQVKDFYESRGYLSQN